MQRRSFVTSANTCLHSNGSSSRCRNAKELRKTNSGTIRTVDKPSRTNTPKRRRSMVPTPELHTDRKCDKELVNKEVNQEVRGTVAIPVFKKIAAVQLESIMKHTKSLTMFDTPAELFDLAKSPPVKKRRSSRLISCDSSDSGDSGVGSREGNDLSTPGTPPTPPTFQPLCVYTDLIEHSFKAFSDNTGSQLLTTAGPTSSADDKRSNNDGERQSKLSHEDEQCKQGISKSNSDNSKRQKKESKDSKLQQRTKPSIQMDMKLASNKHRRSRKDSQTQRSRRYNVNEKMSAEKRRIIKKKYMARRLNPHLRSPERELPKKMARRSLTTTIHQLQKSLTSSPVTPRKRRPCVDTPNKSKQLTLTRAISEEDSGVGSDDQSQKSDDQSQKSEDQSQKLDDESACNWRHCRSQVTGKELQEHLTKVHVVHQTISNRVYRCYWEGCKVYGKIAKSLVWLEGHMLKHLGPKPHHCIYPDCMDHFSTKELLQKHVESHIKTEDVSKSPVKVQPKMKPKRVSRSRILRHSEKCLVRPSDFFSSDVIETLKWEEKILRSNWSHLLSPDGESLTFAGEVMGMCTNSTDGSQQYLIHWSPEQFMVPDSWHPRSDSIAVTLRKQVKVNSLPTDMLYQL